jgi:hypothetical protein
LVGYIGHRVDALKSASRGGSQGLAEFMGE